MNARFKTVAEAKLCFEKELNTICESYNKSPLDMWLEAESNVHSVEIDHTIMRLFRQIRMCDYLLNKGYK